MTVPSEPSPIARLRRAIIQQKTSQMPDYRERNPLFVPLHDALYAYDQHVSQMVIQVLQQGSNADVQTYAQKEDVLQAFNQAEQSIQPEFARFIDMYRNYLARIEQMEDLALQATKL